ncbi:MAG: prolyl oligopeptidase family serine peptidase, partial [Bacteroidota bacterium]
YDTEDKKTHTVLTEVSDTYVREATDDKWHFLSEDKGFLWLSEIDGYQHIYHKASDGSAIAQLTKGEFEVEEILGVDEENELIYFLSTEVSPFERHLYSINFKGKKKKKLTDTAGKHSITVSSALNYFVDSYSTQTKPGVTRLVNNKGESLKTLVDNATLEQRLSKLDIKAPEFFSFTTTEDIDLNGWMIKPTSFDPAKKYPVLMFVYGGPRSQEVLNEWGSFNYLWYQMLAQQGYIIACVDGRGTGARGRDFATVTYGELGKYETIDQIEAAKYLGDQAYIDADRIGIWGWSYGGYMTALCMTKGNGIFKSGISVAPVTNWRFYDTIYTERYLKTPQLNPSGYDQNSPINFANQLQGKLLLVHGTGDDNVHVQNSMEMINALVASNKQFDLFFYPNRNHGIYGGYTRYHLYKKMTDFVLENL